MASDTYVADCIVLKKTKLGEADLILTFLNEEGELVQGIAKGARKPQSAFSSYLELGNTVHILFAKGKRLDVITDTRLVVSHPLLKTDAHRFAAASSILELVVKTGEENLEQPRLFAMTQVALSLCETMEPRYLAHLVAAFLLKAAALSGLRPILCQCASCGAPIDVREGAYAPFSNAEGGALCEGCARQFDHRSVPERVLLRADGLIASRFDDIPAIDPAAESGRALLDLASGWIAVHAATRIRSLELLELYC